MKKQHRNRILAIGTAVVLLAGAVWWRVDFAGNSSAATTAPKATEVKPALTITTVMPKFAEWPVQISATGNVDAWQEASVGAEVNGLRLTEVKVNVGDSVHRGQVLATFSDVAVKADVAQARAAVAEAEAGLAEAKANADRTRQTQIPGVMSAQQIQEYLTAEQKAIARLESAKAQLASQQIRLDQTGLLAPDDGLISARTATVGAVVPAGQELFRLIRGNRLEWRAEVTAADLPRIQSGQSVAISAAGGIQAKGTVRMVAPTVDRATRTAIVYVDLQPQADLKAGMFARGIFDLGHSRVLALPQAAIVQREGFNYAYSVGKDSKVSQIKVEIGRRQGDNVEITAGVDPQAKLAVAGTSFLADGDTVRVVETPASGKGDAQ
jgi:RND family efflux transporter MFP subunit